MPGIGKWDQGRWREAGQGGTGGKGGGMTHASCFSLPTPLKPSDVQTPRSSASASLSRLKQQLADQTATLSQSLAYQTGFKGCRNIMEVLGYNFTWRVEETKHFSAPLKHKHFCPLKHKQLEFFCCCCVYDKNMHTVRRSKDITLLSRNASLDWEFVRENIQEEKNHFFSPSKNRLSNWHLMF